jgi:hypothetical protein
MRAGQGGGRAASSLDSFAEMPAYAGLAADAMARVRARLLGYDDDEDAAVGGRAGGPGPAAPLAHCRPALPPCAGSPCSACSPRRPGAAACAAARRSQN